MAVTETGHRASREVDDLYRRHGPDIYRYAYAVLGNHADAEDVTQTTFLNAYRALEQGVRPRKPANWLLTIASNSIKQRFRQEQARPRLVELDEQIAGYEADEDGDGPSVGELLTALSKIPPQQRQAIVLREFEGRSYSEIAAILSVTTSALETLLFRARRSLAEELEHQLTCTEAQLAVSKSVDGRLGRKERRRLRDHLAECPDCAQFARLQQKHRTALRGLMLLPIPLSLAMFKGLEGAGTASAASAPVVPLHAGGGTAFGTASTSTAGAGSGAATGSGFFLGGAAIKVAAAVVAITVAGGAAITGALEIERGSAPKTEASAGTPQPLGKIAATTRHHKGALTRAGSRASGATAGATAGSTMHSSGAVASVFTDGATAGSETSPAAPTTTPEQTGTSPGQNAPATPTQTSAPTHTTAPTTGATQTTVKPKPTTKPRKGKRVAAAKRANTTKTGGANSNANANASKPKTPGQPSANANSNGSASGSPTDTGNGNSGGTNSGNGNGTADTTPKADTTATSNGNGH